MLGALRIDAKAIRERATGVCKEAPDSEQNSLLLTRPTEIRVALIELINPASGIDQTLLTRVERVRIRGNRAGDDVILFSIDGVLFIRRHGGR